MCGRFVGAFSTERLMAEVGAEVSEAGLSLDLSQGNKPAFWPNYNFAPTQTTVVLRCRDDVVGSILMTWGLVPKWAKDSSRASSMINARAETVSEKPSFRGLLSSHRCIVPMDGFYEWDRSNPKAKLPYFCERFDGGLLLAAGLWTSSPAHPQSPTFSILTRASGSDIETIHDRCPVHFTAEDAVRWMHDTDAPLELVDPGHQPMLKLRRVSTRVNSVRNNGRELLDDVDATDGDRWQSRRNEGQAMQEPPTLF